MMFFGLGGLVYVAVLLTNAIAIISEDRFLARIGWRNTGTEPAFGAGGAAAIDMSIKAKIINLITSVRTLMRIPLIAINTFVIAYELVLG